MNHRLADPEITGRDAFVQAEKADFAIQIDNVLERTFGVQMGLIQLQSRFDEPYRVGHRTRNKPGRRGSAHVNKWSVRTGEMSIARILDGRIRTKVYGTRWSHSD